MKVRCSNGKCQHKTCPHFGPHEEVMYKPGVVIDHEAGSFCSGAMGRVRCVPVQ
jgi:hypothetical protein